MAVSLTGMLLDVSGSMDRSIGEGTNEEGGTWAHSIFEVIDNFIKDDVSSDNHAFAIGFGASVGNEVFDILTALEPATDDQINEIFQILEGAGATYIRKWAEGEVVKSELTNHMAFLFLRKARPDPRFLKKFVQNCLPPECRDWPKFSNPNNNPILGVYNLFSKASDFAYAGAGSSFRQATKQDIKEVIRKAEPDLVKNEESDVVEHDDCVPCIFNVQKASDILHGYIDERKLSKERSQELLRKVKPYIYGGTPLYKAIENAIELIEKNASQFSSHKKLLFILSDGEPADGEITDSVRVERAVSRLKAAGVTVGGCFVTHSTQNESKRLFSEMRPDWDPGAKFLFSLSSKLPTQSIPRTVFVKRDWFIETTNNETSLFLQVNHPDHMQEACQVARDVVCSGDALSEFLTSVSLDVYINQELENYEAKEKHEGSTCYAHASATVIHLALKRIHGRPEDKYPSFTELKNKLVSRFGKEPTNIVKVLEENCPHYNLHFKKVDLKSAKSAVASSRPALATFRLTEDEWKKFEGFFEANKTGILTKKKIDITARPSTARTYGHAVVLTSFNSKYLRLLDSRGPDKKDNGFFKVQNADVLRLKFIDVFWEEDDLTEEEVQRDDYTVTCPECHADSPVKDFTGNLRGAKCPKCQKNFSLKDAPKGNILALNMYLTSLSS
ncbi:uncharacterized protein [Montipora capricornis]|uniref:uncharacterized protein n=1 Tax=Montipora capricornis TaxID=246305 RepID=UPI0035F1E10D